MYRNNVANMTGYRHMTRYEIAWGYLKNSFNLTWYTVFKVMKNIKPLEVKGST